MKKKYLNELRSISKSIDGVVNERIVEEIEDAVDRFVGEHCISDELSRDENNIINGADYE